MLKAHLNYVKPIKRRKTYFLMRQIEKSYPILQMTALSLFEVKGPAQQQQPRQGTQNRGLQAAAAWARQALQDLLSLAPSEGVSYKEKEKAFLICVLFPLLLWASRALEGGCLWAGSARPAQAG